MVGGMDPAVEADASCLPRLVVTLPNWRPPRCQRNATAGRLFSSTDGREW